MLIFFLIQIQLATTSRVQPFIRPAKKSQNSIDDNYYTSNNNDSLFEQNENKIIKNQRKPIVANVTNNNPYRTKTPDSEYLIFNDVNHKKQITSNADINSGEDDVDFSYNSKPPSVKIMNNRDYLHQSPENFNTKNDNQTLKGL